MTRTKEYFQEYYKKNKEKMNKQSREWYKNNRERTREMHAKYQSSHRELYKESQRKWVVNNRDKFNRYRAEYNKMEIPRFKINIRRKSTRKVSLQGKVCEKCECSKNLHRHHNDYNDPFNVTILCKDCHLKWHLNYKPVEPKKRID